MLADPKFGDILAGATPLPDAVAQPAAEKIQIAAAAPLEGGVSSNVPMLQAAVVTISTGRGTGSGFFVSDGHVITNQHVVGDFKFVKVRLASGREIPGEVLRSDRKRDVALIKTEPIGAKSLGIRLTEPNVGEDLYAIGSPLGEKFSGTMTKGILSGHRIMNEQRWIQSDVAILPGNSGGPLLDTSGRVVGISCLALASGMANLNLFIPIGEAMSKLDLSVKE
jgi:S1-C subfamily serine protease